MTKVLSIGTIGHVILIIGGVHLGLVGFFGYDLLTTLFGDGSVLIRVIFGAVGVAAVYSALTTLKLIGK